MFSETVERQTKLEDGSVEATMRMVQSLVLLLGGVAVTIACVSITICCIYGYMCFGRFEDTRPYPCPLWVRRLEKKMTIEKTIKIKKQKQIDKHHAYAYCNLRI